MKSKLASMAALLLLATTWAQAMEPENKEIVHAFNSDGSHYVKASFVNQVWIRYNDNNPGTAIDGYSQDQTFDIGLRRTRFIVQGQLSDKMFFFFQFGQNNMTFSGPRKQPLFVHDAFGQLELIKDKLAVGAGLSGWSGLSRYASPSVGSILTLDAPLYQQATNDVNDQFLRKYSIHAKGKLGMLDYRVAVTKPMTLAGSSVQGTSVVEYSQFSPRPPKPQFQGYFMLQFLDKEQNNTPYTSGTYLGKKNVFNIGAGFIHQNQAMWISSNNGRTIGVSNMSLLALDVFLDHPVDTGKGNVITGYLCFSSTDFGKNYIRNVGVMNPSNGVINGRSSYNGSGNTFPAIGTGSTVYAQLGYLISKDEFGEWGTVQPFLAYQFSIFEALDDPMFMYEIGFNWLIDGNNTKVSIGYQDRPLFRSNQAGEVLTNERRGMAVVQLQVAI